MRTTTLIYHALSLVAAVKAGPLRRRLQPWAPAANVPRQASSQTASSNGQATLTVLSTGPQLSSIATATTTAATTAATAGVVSSTGPEQSSESECPTDTDSLPPSTLATSTVLASSASSGALHHFGARWSCKHSPGQRSQLVASQLVASQLCDSCFSCRPIESIRIAWQHPHASSCKDGHLPDIACIGIEPPVDCSEHPKRFVFSRSKHACLVISHGVGAKYRQRTQCIFGRRPCYGIQRTGVVSSPLQHARLSRIYRNVSPYRFIVHPHRHLFHPAHRHGIPPATSTVSPDVYQSNLQIARGYNNVFATLTEQSACEVGQAACVAGGLGLCPSGQSFKVIPCPDPGAACFALPMNTTEGVLVGCANIVEAKRILGSVPDAMIPTSSLGASSTAPSTTSPASSTDPASSVPGGASSKSAASTAASSTDNSRITSTTTVTVVAGTGTVTVTANPDAAGPTSSETSTSPSESIPSSASLLTDPITRTATVSLSTGLGTITLTINPNPTDDPAATATTASESHPAVSVPLSVGVPASSVAFSLPSTIVFTTIAQPTTTSSTSSSPRLVVIPITDDPTTTTTAAAAATATTQPTRTGAGTSAGAANGAAVTSSSSSAAVTVTVTKMQTQLVTVTETQRETVTATTTATVTAKSVVVQV
ncbi:d0c9ad3e-cc35-487b-bf5e-f42221135e02 [Thermothielavioides terrestris]|uniref:D0c9ad3e-cc35-487b-bf5e-f42221135e02 n=1 Tax=Thermothielavioides terrestris TaxID=2587410 RepID=A0A3S4AWL3_9PEZI|nr:d0c9ad3e-cc35-487b-bf5e-f42221135e02 [Thermothielavioides terrestris]